jgi:hypothetical protein
MTFDKQLCESIFDAFGRNDALRHAYRVYLLRRVRGTVDPKIAATADADFCSLIQAPTSVRSSPSRSDDSLTLESSLRM